MVFGPTFFLDTLGVFGVVEGRALCAGQRSFFLYELKDDKRCGDIFLLAYVPGVVERKLKKRSKGLIAIRTKLLASFEYDLQCSALKSYGVSDSYKEAYQ